jgi:hypothetical protein
MLILRTDQDPFSAIEVSYLASKWYKSLQVGIRTTGQDYCVLVRTDVLHA